MGGGNRSKADSYALVFAMLFPSFVTWLYFTALGGHSAAVQQSAYSVGKLIQFAFPLFWVLLICRESLRWTWPRGCGMGASIGFGLLVLAAMLVLYHFVLKPSGYFTGPGEEIRGKLVGFGFDSFWKYAAFGASTRSSTPCWRSTTGGGLSSAACDGGCRLPQPLSPPVWRSWLIT